MKILDFGSGPKKNIERLWTPDFWIRSLQAHIAETITQLTVHAFDPLEIETGDNSECTDVTICFHNDFETLPQELDAVCALHPNPGVLFPAPYSWDEWSFHHGRYMSMLVHVINKHLKFGGRVMLQFDDELENMWAGNGSDEFIQQISRKNRYSLVEIARSKETPTFPPNVYNFSSFHVLEKKPVS